MVIVARYQWLLGWFSFANNLVSCCCVGRNGGERDEVGDFLTLERAGCAWQLPQKATVPGPGFA